MHSSVGSFANSSQSEGVTRRRFLQGTVALLAPAVAATKVHSAELPAGTCSTPAAEKTAETVAYGKGTLPAGIRSRFVNNSNGLTMHVLEAGFEDQGPALRPAAARLPRAGVQLAQGDAAAGRRRVSRDRPGPARLRANDGLGRQLRRRPRLLPHAQPGPRHVGLVWLSATARSRPWSGTISARSSRAGVRWSGRTCSARWC